ncbi:MAG TPA: hypothetical protein GX512_03740 [Firmicutes bacterium]|nr:hypothetical protein [Candidatus Fermentithermobacillaceae bacterium]
MAKAKTKVPKFQKVKPLLYLYRDDIGGIPDSLKKLDPGDEVEVTALVRVLTKSVDPKGIRSMEVEFNQLKPSKKGR